MIPSSTRIAAILAKQERLKISERTVAGLERARKQGRRPAEAGAGPGPGAASSDGGKSLREISDAMGLSLTTTARILKTA
jgi:DNA invertase Pin-like site-specific DNA recombinase